MAQYFMDSTEFNQLSFGLEEYHLLFYKLWSLGNPMFDSNIKTAQVAFNPVGDCISITINPDFWAQQSLEQKLFIICHEYKHVINQHGRRANHIHNAEDRKLANIAMDICVNEDLVDRFGFTRTDVDPGNNYIWADKVAARLGLDSLPTNQSFEFYYNLFDRLPPDTKSDIEKAFDTMDDHSQLDMPSPAMQSIMEKIAESIDAHEDLEAIKSIFKSDKDSEAGTKGLGAAFAIKIQAKKSRKWETVIKKWSRKALINQEKETQSWVFPNRRLITFRSDLSLPSDMVTDNRHTVGKIKVWFFLDTSGSCIGLRDRFFNAAKSLPKDRFEIELLCFDTEVYRTTLESGQVFGGGGTDFTAIEKFIHTNTVLKGTKYPEAVFLITDGYAGPVKPQHPDRWYWFLTPGGKKTSIPKESKIFKLEDYE